MTYDELYRLYKQEQPKWAGTPEGIGGYLDDGGRWISDYVAPDAEYRGAVPVDGVGQISTSPDGSFMRVESYNDGEGRLGGFDVYADGRQVPWGIDKSQSGWERFRSVALPIAGFALGAGALAPYFAGAGAAEAAGAAGAAGSSITPEIGAAIAGAGDAGAAGGLGGAFGGSTFGAGTLPTTLGMGTVGEGFIGMPSIAEGTLSAGEILGGGGAALGSGYAVPGASSLLGGSLFSGTPFGVPGASSPAIPPVTPPGTTPPGTAPTGAATGGVPRLSDGSIDWTSLLTNPALLSAAAGAAAGIAGNSDITSSQTGTTAGTTSASQSSTGSQGLAPWLQGYAQDYLGRAQGLANAPSSNATMDAGRNLLTGLAGQGDPLVNAARTQQQNLIGGGMLNANPYIDSVATNIGNRMGDAYKRGTAANTDAAFARSKAFGGSAWDEQQQANSQAFGDSLGQTMSNLYYGNYQGERAAQDAASRGSLQFGQFGATNAGNLYNLGAQDWQRPFAQNAQYGAAINPAWGSQTANTANTTGSTNANTTQNSTMQAPNNWMAGAGGAANALALYRLFNPTARS